MQLKRKTGFSLVEILVVVAIIGLLIAILLPALSIVRRSANRRNDGTNLKGIFTGLVAYADDNGSSYPKYATENPVAAVQGFTAANTTAPTGVADAAFTNNVTAALWLMVRGEYVQPSLFINPSSSDVVTVIDSANVISDYYDFAVPDNLSYSMINMYDSVISAKWTASVGPEAVMLANNNNGLTGDSDVPADTYANGVTGAQLRTMNSIDHDSAGQNMSFGDGSVSFKSTPMGAFSESDNIYTYNNDAADKSDTTAITALTADNTAAGAYASNGSTVNTAQAGSDVFMLPLDDLGD